MDAGIYLREDTIVALSTPPGRGAIAVLRLSGPQSIDLCRRVFVSRGKNKDLAPRRAAHGFLCDPITQERIDDVLCMVFRAPRSYTGEDMAEIHCHGSEAVVRRALEILYALDARAAEPGEFTFRAVRSGKLDLAQAEAVAALIDSRTQLARKMSLRMLEGAFSRSLAELREDAISLLVEVETQIEFPDDAMEEALGRHLQQKSEMLLAQSETLRQRAVREQRFEQGIVVVLAGRPNVGKSSLFNRLLGRERAIVTPHAGTTRDSIEGMIDLAGWPVTLIDTAGLRETQEEIEAIGIQRSRELLSTSHIVLYIFEAGAGLTEEDRAILTGFSRLSDTRLILAGNKKDLGESIDISNLGKEFLQASLVLTSAHDDKGVEPLVQELERHVQSLAPAETDTAFLISARQERVLVHIYERLVQTNRLFNEKAPLELAAEELRNVLQDIAELDGTGVAPDIMTTIFSRFCIGK